MTLPRYYYYFLNFFKIYYYCYYYYYYYILCCSMAMTSPDKTITGGNDVTVKVATSQSGSVGCERPEMKRAVVANEVDQSSAVTTDTSTSPRVSVALTASSSRASAVNDDRCSGSGSRNPDACGWVQSIGRLRQKLEEIRPMSTSTLFRARTVGPTSGQSICDAGVDSRTPVTITTGSYSINLRKAAAADGNSRLPAESTTDRSSVVSSSAAADSRFDGRSVPGQALQGPAGLLATFPRRSSHDAAQEVRQASTSTMPTHLQMAKTAKPSTYNTVSGPRRSLTNSSDCHERTVTRTSMSSANVDSYSSPVCRISTAGDGQNPTLSMNVDSCASASPQLRRWNGNQSSTATQAGSVDHHHRQLQQQESDHATKPHSVPCSPRLQARLAAIQPWRPWSPSKSDRVVACPVQTIGNGRTGSATSADLSQQLASSLLLTKVIRDHQEAELSYDLKSRGNYVIATTLSGVSYASVNVLTLGHASVEWVMAASGSLNW